MQLAEVRAVADKHAEDKHRLQEQLETLRQQMASHRTAEARMESAHVAAQQQLETRVRTLASRCRDHDKARNANNKLALRVAALEKQLDVVQSSHALLQVASVHSERDPPEAPVPPEVVVGLHVLLRGVAGDLTGPSRAARGIPEC